MSKMKVLMYDFVLSHINKIGCMVKGKWREVGDSVVHFLGTVTNEINAKTVSYFASVRDRWNAVSE